MPRVCLDCLHVHGRQRQNLGPLLLPELCCHNPADSGSNGLAGLVDEHASIVVELDHAAVGPLPLLRCPDHDGVAHVSSPDLVGCADGYAVAGFRAKVALFLHHDYYAVACACVNVPCCSTSGLVRRVSHTDFGRALGSQDIDALDNGGARVVDAVDE